ncbi:hypothetical protein [Cerasicoccus arenae]|uniref:hypothetical protein n=1 Tax=Cerasicoccus arenae TaxID=424488 RepID=UPI00167B1CBE|nr:hypothetical protein [Cerasicoccus arenae]
MAMSLAAFILLLLLSMATLTKVEVHAATNAARNSEARQNAILALSVAIGELQRHTGPDQRVTGQADILIPESVDVGVDMDSTAEMVKFDDYWNDRRNRHWVGAWSNGNEDDFDPQNPTTANALPDLKSWLVSGNENGVTFDPIDQITGLTLTSSPRESVLDINGKPHRILVSPGNGTDLNAMNRAVTAPEVSLTTDSGLTTGHYAYWVGDEGVKARVNLVDPYAGELASSDTYFRRIASAQRVAAEAIATSKDDGFAAIYQPNDAKLSGIFELDQLGLLYSDDNFRDEIDENIHDVTVYSRGVLADVKHGGLKRDLSYILGQSDINSLRSAVAAVYDGPVIDPSADYNRVLNEEVSPLAEVPTGMPFVKVDPYVAPGILAYTPTWEMLWSFNNMGNQVGDVPAGVFNDRGQAVPRLLTSTQHGIHPIVVHSKLYYGLRIQDGQIWVNFYPLVVLANPYSVPLGPSDYTIRFASNQPKIGFDELEPTDDPLDPEPDDFKENSISLLPNGGLGEIKLVLRSSGMEAGVAQIFTVEEFLATVPIPKSTAAQREFEVIMVNDFSPDAHLTYNTEVSITPPNTHAILYGSSSYTTKLYMDYDPNERDRKLLQIVTGHYVADPGGTTDFDGIYVYPMNADNPINGNEMKGTGLTCSLSDIVHNITRTGLFYERNYRTNYITGYHSATSRNHLTEWGAVHQKKGYPGNEGYYHSHLLMKPGNYTNVRWGPIATGTGSYNTLAPSPFLDSDVGFENLLYSIPDPKNPLTSLGQLQHLNTNAFIDRVDLRTTGSDKTSVQSWQVNYPISNSYPHYLVSRDKLFESPYSGTHYDGSYIWNEILWDRFYLSSYPASGEFDFNTDTLVNARYRPFRSLDDESKADESLYRGSGSATKQENSRMAAKNLISEGAFNVNSTSPEAWKAVLSSLRDIKIGSEIDTENLTAPFTRTIHRSGATNVVDTVTTEDSWRGFRNLTTDQIDQLANEIVLQVRLRGPFLSMSDFVNRRLIPGNYDVYGLGLSGALQSAIDATIHSDDFESQINTISHSFDKIKPKFDANRYAERDYMKVSTMVGSPGYLLQADVLSALGPYLTARSDTFRIRAYGDVVNPISQKVESQSWCEAVVQRLPDYVSSVDDAYSDPTDSKNIAFGRRYQIVSFRWLDHDEL